MDAVDLGQSVPLIPLQVDPPDHRKYRRLLDPIFAPRRMNLLEPEITRLVNELIDGFIDKGECEFAADFAVPLPSSVFLALVGLPLSDLDSLPGDEGRHPAAVGCTTWTRSRTARRRPPVGSRTTSPMRSKDRRANPRDDILSLFIEAEVDSRAADRGRDPRHLLPVHPGRAGHGHRLARVLHRPAGPAPRRAPPDRGRSGHHPLGRRGAPAVGDPGHHRGPGGHRDVDLGGCPIHAGDNVGIVIGSANTDDEAVPGSDQVDLARSREPAPGLRRRRPPLPRIPPGPARAAHRPPRVAPAHPGVLDRPGHRAQLHDGAPQIDSLPLILGDPR